MSDVPDEIMERALECGALLLDDITDRRGWRQEWDQFDEEVREEIQQVHADIIARALMAERKRALEEAAKVAEIADLQDGIDNGAAATRSAGLAAIAIRKLGEGYPLS